MLFKNTIFNWQWLSNPRPHFSASMLWAGLVVIILMLVGLIFIKFFYHPQSDPIQEYTDRWRNLLLSCVILLSVVLFASWQGLPTLGSGMAFLLIVIVFVGWSLWLICLKLFLYNKKNSKFLIEQRLKSYLPTKKGNK